MSNIVALPVRPRSTGSGGTIHVWRHASGIFEIGHESRSGNSWGFFEEFPTAGAAIDGAHTLNREKLGKQCAVWVSPAVFVEVPAEPSPEGVQ